MGSLDDISFIDYIEENGIRLSNIVNHIDKKDIDEKKAIEQIQTIADFHSIARGYNGLDVKTIKNKIGKLVGQYKIHAKKLKKYADMKKKRSNLTMFEEYFLNTCESVIERCEKCLGYINDDEYMEIIKRSMRNNDICLGNCYFENLWKNGNIFLADYSDIAFNMVEIDGVKFIGKLKSNSLDLNFELLIDKYIEAENIKSESKNLMKALISYPSEYIKCVERYERNSDESLEDRFVKRLAKSIRKDGDSII
ncbi:spore coat protein [Clostridium acetobutylicum]|nr:spore coat protein [Clostridium acetobutylicum]